MLDILIRNGTVVDGSGEPGEKSIVGISEGRIVAVGGDAEMQAGQIVDAAGLVVAPGFIDVHSHSDFACLLHPVGVSSISQGITTEIVGNCGYSPAPYRKEMLESMHRRFYDRSYGPGVADRIPWSWRTFGQFLDVVEARGTGLNRAFLVGHGAIRGMVLGMEQRPANTEETQEMRDLVTEALEHGAFGMSTGLEYAPGSFAGTPEVTATAEALRPFGRVFTSHMRNESSNVGNSVEEIINIGKAAEIPVHISHHNVVGRENRGMLSRTMARIDEERQNGLDLSLDYCHFQPFYHPLPLDAIAPDWHHEPSFEVIKRKLLSKEAEGAVRAAYASGWKSDLEIVFPDANWDYTILWGPGIESLVGTSIADIADNEKRDPLQVCFDLIQRASDRVIVSRVIHPDDTRAVLMNPNTMLSTDTYALDQALPEHITLHPRNYGAFACFFGRYVRERRWLPLEEGVRRCTSLPARRFGLRDRGSIREGMMADVVIFDPSTVLDQATVTDPTRLCNGIETVIINGLVVWRKSQLVASRAGTVLRA